MTFPVGNALSPKGSATDTGDLIIWNNRFFTVTRGAVQASSSGNNEIVAAESGKRVLLLAYNLMSNGIVNAAWRSGATTVIGGRGFFTEAGRGKVVPYNPKGWAITASGEALNLNLSAAIAVEGEAVWAVVPA